MVAAAGKAAAVGGFDVFFDLSGRAEEESPCGQMLRPEGCV